MTTDDPTTPFRIEAMDRWPAARPCKVEMVAGALVFEGDWDVRDVEAAERTYPGRSVWIDVDGYLIIAAAGTRRMSAGDLSAAALARVGIPVHPAATPRVASVHIVGARVVHLMFSDGSGRVVDLEPMLTGPVFARIAADDAVFAAMYVDAELGTIAWPGGADIAPETLYAAGGG